MIRRFLIFNMIGGFLWATAGMALADSTNTSDSHLQVINQELDQIEAYLGNSQGSSAPAFVNAQSVTSSAASIPVSKPEVIAVAPITVNIPPKKSAIPEDLLPTSSILIPRNNELEVNPEFYWTQFKESGFSEKGSMIGYDVKYTHRFINPTKIPVNMVGLQGQWAWGKVKQPADQGPSGIKDNAFEIRAVLGKDFHPWTHIRTTGYTGYGFRYLNDNSSGLQSEIDGFTLLGYDRVSHYSYIPIGMDFLYQTDPRYSWQANLEYDFLLDGWQVNKIGVVPGYNTMTVSQKDGFGLRASVRFNWNLRYGTAFAEWFWRYWNIAQSQSIPDPTDATLPALYEPKNTTSEIGLRLGLDI